MPTDFRITHAKKVLLKKWQENADAEVSASAWELVEGFVQALADKDLILTTKRQREIEKATAERVLLRIREVAHNHLDTERDIIASVPFLTELDQIAVEVYDVRLEGETTS